MRSRVWMVSHSPTILAAWTNVLILFLGQRAIEIRAFGSVGDFPQNPERPPDAVVFGRTADVKLEHASLDLWRESIRDDLRVLTIIEGGSIANAISRLI